MLKSLQQGGNNVRNPAKKRYMLKGSANYSELTATLLTKSGKHSAGTQTDEKLFIIYPAAEAGTPKPL